MKSILIIDPDSAGEQLCETLTSQGYGCVMARDARTATSILQSGMHVDLVIAETRLPDADGLDFLAGLLRTNPSLPVIIVTAEGSVEKYLQAANLGVAEYLTKPLYMKELTRIVRLTLNQSAFCSIRPGPDRTHPTAHRNERSGFPGNG